MLRSRDGHVQPVLVTEKAKPICANTVEQDDFLFAALEGVYRGHFDVLVVDPLFYFLRLTLVWCDDAD